MTTTASRLNIALNIRNMKATDLHRATGINKSSISQYLAGVVCPKQDRIYLLAKALNVNELWLMGHDVPMERTAVPSSSEEFTQADKDMVYAYHKAPDHIQQSVDAVLGPYKPDKVIAAVADEEKAVHYLNPYVRDYSPNNPEIPNFKTPKELKLFLNWLYKPEYVEDTYQYIKELFTLIQARATAPNTNYTEFIFSSIRRFILEDPDGFMRDFVYAKNPSETVLSASDSIYNWMFPQQEAYIFP